MVSGSSERTTRSSRLEKPRGRKPQRKGKAPLVDPFTGEDKEVTLEEWLPSLERAADWNEWTEEDQLLQLAGYLRGKALQEWRLIPDKDKKSLQPAISVLRGRLDPASQALAAQEFRHLAQNEQEAV